MYKNTPIQSSAAITVITMSRKKSLEQWQESFCYGWGHLGERGLERAQTIRTLFFAALADWMLRVYMDSDQSTSLKVSITWHAKWQDGSWHKKQMLTPTPRHAHSGRRSIVSSWLSSKFVGKENVSVLSQSPQRFICKCHTCQIVSNCVSRRCHIFPGTEKNQRVKMTK